MARGFGSADAVLLLVGFAQIMKIKTGTKRIARRAQYQNLNVAVVGNHVEVFDYLIHHRVG